MKPKIYVVNLHQKAEIYLAQGKLEEAIAVCQQVLKIQPNFPPNCQTLGNIWQRMSEIDKAKDWYIKAINEQPNVAESYANLGSIYAQQKQWQLGIECYREAIGIKPNIPSLYRNLGKIWQELGKLELARDCQEQALTLEAHYSQASEYFKHGKNSLENGETEEAIASFQQAIKLNPSLIGAYQNLGDISLKTKELNKAINYYQKAIELKPDLWAVHHKLGKVFQEIRELDAAINSFALSIEINPNFPWSYKKLGEILEQKGELEEAVKFYKQFIKLQPDVWATHRKINEILWQQGKFEELIDRCNYAPENDPNLSWNYQRLGDIYTQRKAWDEAIIAYRHSLEIEVDKDWIYKKLGDALQAKGLIDEAISSYQKAIEINPNSCWYYGALGNAYIQQQKFSEAIPYFIEALKLKPNYYEVNRDIEYILKKQNRHEAAQIWKSQKHKRLPQDWIEKFLKLTGDWEITSDTPANNIIRIKIYSANQINLLHSQTIDEQVHSIFRDKKANSPEVYVAVLPEGRGCVKLGATAVITSDNKLVKDISTGCAEVIISSSKLPPVHYIDGTVAFFSGIWGRSNYFHWMIDVVTRIELLRKSHLKIDKFVFLECQTASQKETLATLKIPTQKIIESKFYPHIRAKKLVVPSFTAKQNGLRVTKWGCEFLRTLFLKPENMKNVSGKPERIYISRKYADYRKVINEQEVINLLNKFGFISVTLESISVTEQASYMAAAKVIVAPHGAGLTNIIFCSPGTKIIEIFAANFVIPLYWQISSLCNLLHYHLIAEGVESNLEEHLLWRQNIFVNLQRLLKILTLAKVV
ncbi:MAG: tetratricopeptide repeat protein [Cyanobacteria bacterium P01_H01_bin.35]